ncbi:hypothetical protein NPIL_253201 [Nephila pilipes]|uniref:Uncharacterized protein n=1 Tax=Nephila pilipes TaxID=299642 RepID=A0A8X6N5Q3_NEPPI|nr:hypothetical protein NPIL_253201 [Nephila pilipes]
MLLAACYQSNSTDTQSNQIVSIVLQDTQAIPDSFCSPKNSPVSITMMFNLSECFTLQLFPLLRMDIAFCFKDYFRSTSPNLTTLNLIWLLAQIQKNHWKISESCRDHPVQSDLTRSGIRLHPNKELIQSFLPLCRDLKLTSARCPYCKHSTTQNQSHHYLPSSFWKNFLQIVINTLLQI